jgi:magnesium chelatase family protein
VPRVELSDFEELVNREEDSASAAVRVAHARRVQMTRQGVCNARLPDSQVDRWCRPDRGGRDVLELAIKRLGFSARARGRILKLARTVADLGGEETVTASHVSQAIMLRCLDRTLSDCADRAAAPAHREVRPETATVTSPVPPCNRPPA